MAWETPRKYFRGLNLDELDTDEAYLNVTWTGEYPAWLYRLSGDCVACPWERWFQVNQSTIHKISTHHPTHLLGRNDGLDLLVRTDSPALESTTLCKETLVPGQFGVYHLDLLECRMQTELEPVKENLAIVICLLVLMCLALITWALKRWAGNPVRKIETWLGWERQESGGGSRARVRSLDTFRGVAIALMIFVNDGAGHYWFLEHSTWNGLYVADLVFPWFVWIMGVCIPMSVRSNKKKKVPLTTVIWGITKRSVKLFLLGFILNTLGGWINLTRLRVPGVLQRFGVSYFVVAIIANLLAKPHRPPVEKEPPGITGPGHFADVVDLLPQWVVMAVVVVVHQLVVWLVPVPGCPQGYRGPGGLHDWSPERNNSNCIGGITGYIDKAFFTSSHIYGNPTAKVVYQASAFDPEGILGSLTTIFQVWIGYQAGYILQVHSGHKQRVARWMIWALLTGAIGAVLCGCSQNDGWVPVNKNLWSISFVLVTSSFAFVLLSFLYVTIDMNNWWKGQPFFYAGMNSILLYCGHSVGYNLFPWHFVVGDMRTHTARLFESVWGTALWMCVAYVLYKKRVFVTV